jgi:NAD(P)-dependent dehydrogenase (short-subunit alcohol dehydrogenase family)
VSEPAAARALALVTGASRGLGAAIADALAPTHDLVLVARTAAALAATATRVRERGARVHACLGAQLDDDAELAGLLAELAAFPIDVLVCNAGIAPSATLGKTDDALWDSVIATNLGAPFKLARVLVPAMAKRGHGRVVNIASTAALKGYRFTSAYSASKGGLVALTRALAAELAGTGVTANAICPGFCDTDIVAEAARRIGNATGRGELEARERLAGFSPLHRLVAPDEVAALVAYLCSDAAAAIHGQAFAIDGGETSL